MSSGDAQYPFQWSRQAVSTSWPGLTCEWASLVHSMVKNPPANARDAGSIPGLGRSPGDGDDNLPQYSCLGNLMDREAWQATVHGVATT